MTKPSLLQCSGEKRAFVRSSENHYFNTYGCNLLLWATYMSVLKSAQFHGIIEILTTLRSIANRQLLYIGGTGDFHKQAMIAFSDGRGNISGTMLHLGKSPSKYYHRAKD